MSDWLPGQQHLRKKIQKVRTIRASEIASYLYCQRAWWYQRQGIESENQASLAGGTQLHARHGRSMMISSCLRWIAYAILLLALSLATIHIAGLVFNS
jgi:CRISPR/Cas system-associated exonuclease Cas4 (RecB family)